MTVLRTEIIDGTLAAGTHLEEEAVATRFELGDVFAGLAPGRTHRDQITLFNSVGVAPAVAGVSAARRRPVCLHAARQRDA